MNDTIDIKSKKYFAYLKNNEWTLCLGAGICNGLLPDWGELTRRVVNECFKFSWDQAKFYEETSRVPFFLDAWLQASLNNLIKNGGTVEEFYGILENQLYSDLISLGEKNGLKKAIAILLNDPTRLNKKQLLATCEFFESHFSGSTLMQLKNILLIEDKEVIKPKSIITFNADSLLYCLLVIFQVKENYLRTGEYNFHFQRYVRVTRPFQIGFTKTPIYHLHGAIFTKPIDSRKFKDDARDNLIFSESSYVKLAGSMHTWAQNNFIYQAMNTRMVFVGMSMSDPNVRRWLSWTAENIKEQIQIFKGKEKVPLRHLWIRTAPKDKELIKLLEPSLRHLSTKIGWISNWSDLEDGLTNLMGGK